MLSVNAKRSSWFNKRSRLVFSATDSTSSSWVIPHLLYAHEVAKKAMNSGYHPFGAILVGPDQKTVLDEQGNLDTVRHAESTLALRAFSTYESDFLWQCTLVTTVEPCAMCAGTQYWANIGRLVFGMTEKELLQLTGNHHENPTLNLSAATVLGSGQKKIEIIGPVPEVQDVVTTLHRGFWQSPRNG
jgi:tRNA(Arg) A34 adenosine deaminase TadA